MKVDHGEATLLWYDVRARYLLARYRPGERRNMDVTDLLLLAYVADPPPLEAWCLERIVADDIGFGVAMSALFSSMGLAPVDWPATVSISISSRLSRALDVEPVNLVGPLHSRLCAMVCRTSELDRDGRSISPAKAEPRRPPGIGPPWSS